MASPSSPAPPLSSILIRAAASALAEEDRDDGDGGDVERDDVPFPTYASVDGGGGSGSYPGHRRGYDGYDEHERGLIQLIHSIFTFLATLIRTTIWTTAILSASVVIYGAFYVAVMPTVSVRRPLYFDYMHEVIVQHHHRSVMMPEHGGLGRHRSYDDDTSAFLGRDNARADHVPPPTRNDEKEGGDIADRACTAGTDGLGGRDDEDVGGGEGGGDGARDCGYGSDDAGMASSDLPPPPRAVSWKESSSEVATSYLEEDRHHHRYYIPTATVDLLSPHDQWDAYHHHHHHRLQDHHPHPEYEEDNPAPRPRLLSPGVRHYVEVALTLPESPSNLNVGVFMVQLELLSDDNGHQQQHHDGSDDSYSAGSTVGIGGGGTPTALLARSRRPALFPYESGLIRYVRKISLLVPLLIGAMPEARTVVVPSLTHFVDDDEERPLRRARVRVLIPPPHPHGSSDGGWTGQRRQQVQILAAELRIGREPNAFQSLLREWFFTCAAVGVSLIASTLGFMVLLIRMTFWTLAARAKARAAECVEEEGSHHEGGGDDDDWGEIADDDGVEGVGRSLAASSLDVDVDVDDPSGATGVDDEIVVEDEDEDEDEDDDDDVEVDGAEAECGLDWEDFDGDWEELDDYADRRRRRRGAGAGAAPAPAPPRARTRVGSGTGRRWRRCRDGRNAGNDDGPHPSTPSPPDLEEDTDDVGVGGRPRSGGPKREASSGREGDNDHDDSSERESNERPTARRKDDASPSFTTGASDGARGDPKPGDREQAEGGDDAKPAKYAHRSGGRRKKAGKKKKVKIKKKKKSKDAAVAGGVSTTDGVPNDAAATADPSCEKESPANDKKSEEALLDEKVRVERVMRGLVEPYEIFTGEQTQTHVKPPR